ncbi:MAG: 2Fe-2S ferredoxin [Actinomycetia bacterium]|nr:2Fe-2S ferredoxin [Actinomycetes bacterium]
MVAETLSQALLPTLPGRSYYDPGVFAAEQEHIFEAMWFCAVRASELDRPGRFRTVQIGRESVIVSRNKAGDPRAFLNVCRHRGARLCTEESGEVRNTFKCAYHAWAYDLDGALVGAPHFARMNDVDRGPLGLASAHVREWLGYVWVCLADRPPSFEDTVIADVVERLGDLSPLDGYRVADLSVGKRISYDVKANWKLIIENFLECYHCATIHPELVRVLPEFSRGLAAQSYVGHGAEFGKDIEGFTVDGGAGFDRLPDLADEQDRRYFAMTLKPQVFVNLVPDHVIFHRMFPVSATRTIVECDWLYSPEVTRSDADMSRSVELFDRVNLQDFEACELCQPAMESRAYAAGGVLVPAEHHMTAFHSWYLDTLAGPDRG